MRRLVYLFMSVSLALGLVACDAQQETSEDSSTEASVEDTDTSIESNPLRNPYFGDLHVHTNWSFDAFMFGNRTTPDDAYRFAKGETILHPSGREMTLPQPLDFQAVTDHGIYMGIMRAMFNPFSSVGAHPLAVRLRTARVNRRIARRVSRHG